MRKHRPKDRILAFHLQELAYLFDGLEKISFFSFSRSTFGKAVVLLRLLIKFRVLGVVQTGKIFIPGQEFRIRRGLIPNMRVFLGYFQSPLMLQSKGFEKLKIKSKFLKTAEEILANLPTQKKNLFFMHLRRGDYLVNFSNGSLVVPTSWFLEQKQKIEALFPDAYFLVFSDGLKDIAPAFAAEKNAQLMDYDSAISFTLMTLCEGGGILSASTYSYCAARFCKKNFPNSYFLGPKIEFSDIEIAQAIPRTGWIFSVPVEKIL